MQLKPHPRLGHLLFLRVYSALSGGMTIPQAQPGDEVNREIALAGRFVPIVDFLHMPTETHSHVSDIPSRLPASAHVSSNKSALVTFSHADGDLMRNVPRLHPIPSQTGFNPWQLQYHSTFHRGSSVLRSQETVQWVTPRAR